jgi:hypothetical protein
MENESERIVQFKQQLQKDFEIIAPPLTALIVTIAVVAISTIWKQVLFLLFFILGWAIFWIAGYGIPRALGATFRIFANLIRLGFLLNLNRKMAAQSPVNRNDRDSVS